MKKEYALQLIKELTDNLEERQWDGDCKVLIAKSRHYINQLEETLKPLPVRSKSSESNFWSDGYSHSYGHRPSSFKCDRK